MTVDNDISSICFQLNKVTRSCIYYLKPKTTDMYLLNFNKPGFEKEKLRMKNALPKAFSSVQTQNQDIYVSGGHFAEV